MADTGSRMERQQAFTPTPARDLMSAEQHEYVDGVPGMRQEYAQNPVYNGTDALRRLRGSDD